MYTVREMAKPQRKGDALRNVLRAGPRVTRHAIVDAAILSAVGIAAWTFIQRTETCTRFFAYVAAHPETEYDSIILAGMFSALGFLAFAFRRWHEASRAERRFRKLAYRDVLTELPNRRAFIDALEQAAAGEYPFTCLLLDLDKFKQVNDLRGHTVGDKLLQRVSEQLRGFVTPDVLLAPIGGDEFGMLVTDKSDSAVDLAQRIAEGVGEPMLLEDHAVQTSLSVGVARFPGDSTEPGSLLRKADIALYSAKACGRGLIKVFNQTMEEKDRRWAAVAEALRNAIPRGEVVPFYQPVVELVSGEIVGFEVLSRWESATLGPVAPSEFIPIAVEAGLISSLSYAVLEHACTDAALWPIPLRLSFNIAPHQFSDPLLHLQLLAILSKTGLAPSRLEIELTEDALLVNDQSVALDLNLMKDQGITLALDDFGTGYSSLHHLRMLPFDKVKIDRSYIDRIESCPKSKRMVEAIINFTQLLGIPVLAEGVETSGQARILSELDCDLAQGWLYGKAVSGSAVNEHFQPRARMIRSSAGY